MTSFGTSTVLRPRHATLLLSFAALVAGCSETQRKQSADTLTATAATSKAASVDTTPHTRPPRPTNPCSFVAGSGACAGLLAGAVPTVDELNKGGVLVPALHSSRKPSNGDAKTFVNKDARKIDLDQLPSGQSLLIGSIEFAQGSADDIYYHTTGGGGNNDKSHTVWIVLSGPATHASATNGIAVGTWSMYGLDPATNGVKVIAGPRSVVECEKDSPANSVKGPNSYFGACQPIDSVHALAHEVELPFDAVLAYVACRPDKNGNCTVLQQHGPQGFTVMSVSQRSTLLKGIRLLTLDATIDPYWFSCGQGCCTAE